MTIIDLDDLINPIRPFIDPSLLEGVSPPRPGTVRVSGREKNGKVTLSVHRDGRGFAFDMTPKDALSIGEHLVQSAEELLAETNDLVRRSSRGE